MLYAVMFTETDGCEYSVDIVQGVYDTPELAKDKIDKDVKRCVDLRTSHRLELPRDMGCYPNEYSILPFTVNEDW
jgi:hypothetical protein